MSSQVQLKPLDPVRAMSIRQIVATPVDVGNLLGESYMAMMTRGIESAGMPFVIFHDPAFKTSDLDIEVAIPVAASVTGAIPLDDSGQRQLQVKEIAGVKSAVSLVHQGDFAQLPAAYAEAGRWIEANGYRLAGPNREVYLSAPDDPDGAKTEIQLPVEK